MREPDIAVVLTSTTHVPAGADEALVFPRVKGRVRIDPGTAAGGAGLPPGRYDVRVTISTGGFAAEAAARVGEAPFTITVSPGRRVTPSQRVGDAARRPSRLGRLRAWIARAAAPHPRTGRA